MPTDRQVKVSSSSTSTATSEPSSKASASASAAGAAEAAAGPPPKSLTPGLDASDGRGKKQRRKDGAAALDAPSSGTAAAADGGDADPAAAAIDAATANGGEPSLASSSSPASLEEIMRQQRQRQLLLADGGEGGATASDVPLTSWPASCPADGEDHVVSIVCGNSHLHWAFHHGVRSDVNPALFWRTPPLDANDLETGPLPEALSRHLPQFAHDYIFGTNAPAALESALEAARANRPEHPRIAVYVVSTNSDQVSLLARLWLSVPCRLYVMKGDDFFTEAEGRYDTMGVDRLATLRGAAEIHGFPALVFDGGTANTYTAADGDGRIMGGGIGPGLYVKFRSLNEYTDALPHVGPDEVLARVRDAVLRRRPLPTFGTNTKEAIMVDVLGELAAKGRRVIEHWLEKVGDGSASGAGGGAGNGPGRVAGGMTRSAGASAAAGMTEEETKTSDGRTRGGSIKLNAARSVLITGGDGEILSQLFQPDHSGIVESTDVAASSGGAAGGATSDGLGRKKYEIHHAKHLIHYGISAAIMRQVERRRNAERRAKIRSEMEDNERLVGQRVAKRFDQPDSDGECLYRGEVKGIERGKEEGGGGGGGKGRGKGRGKGHADDDEDYYLIEYDDGDRESVTLVQLQDMITLYNEVGEKEVAAPQGRRKKSNQPTSPPPPTTPAAKPVPQAKMPVALTSSAKGVGKKRKASTTDTASVSSAVSASSPGRKRGKVAGAAAAAVAETAPSPEPSADASSASTPAPTVKPEDYVGNRVAKKFDKEIYFGTVTEYVKDAEDVEGGLWHVVYDDGDEEDFEKKELRNSLKFYEKKKGDDPNPIKEGKKRKSR